jgi:hypothetical protein
MCALVCVCERARATRGIARARLSVCVFVSLYIRAGLKFVCECVCNEVCVRVRANSGPRAREHLFRGLCVYLSVFVRVRARARATVRVYVCMYERLCMCVRAHVLLRFCVCCVYVCARACSFVCLCVFMCVCVNVGNWL